MEASRSAEKKGSFDFCERVGPVSVRGERGMGSQPKIPQARPCLDLFSKHVVPQGLHKNTIGYKIMCSYHRT